VSYTANARAFVGRAAIRESGLSGFVSDLQAQNDIYNYPVGSSSTCYCPPNPEDVASADCATVSLAQLIYLDFSESDLNSFLLRFNLMLWFGIVFFIIAAASIVTVVVLCVKRKDSS
jgi:hypothetical protein